jgi:hypothetical protein
MSSPFNSTHLSCETFMNFTVILEFGPRTGVLDRSENVSATVFAKLCQ